MAETDAYSSSSTELDEEPSTPIDQAAPPAHSTRKRRSKTPCGSQRNTRKKQVRLPVSLRSLVPLQKHVTKKLKGHDIDDNVSLRVVAAALQLQKDYLQAKQKAANALVQLGAGVHDGRIRSRQRCVIRLQGGDRQSSRGRRRGAGRLVLRPNNAVPSLALVELRQSHVFLRVSREATTLLSFPDDFRVARRHVAFDALLFFGHDSSKVHAANHIGLELHWVTREAEVDGEGALAARVTIQGLEGEGVFQSRWRIGEWGVDVEGWVGEQVTEASQVQMCHRGRIREAA